MAISKMEKQELFNINYPKNIIIKSIFSPTSLEDLLNDAPQDAKELVKSLLVLDPLKRLTATDALNHKYIER